MSIKLPLSESPINKTVRICEVKDCEGPHACRMMELGFVEGAECCVLSKTFFGDPIRVRVGDCHMSIRSKDANLIITEDGSVSSIG